jgi:hypothetical protein
MLGKPPTLFTGLEESANVLSNSVPEEANSCYSILAIPVMRLRGNRKFSEFRSADSFEP